MYYRKSVYIGRNTFENRYLFVPKISQSSTDPCIPSHLQQTKCSFRIKKLSTLFTDPAQHATENKLKEKKRRKCKRN
jgi:hypothetical protein